MVRDEYNDGLSAEDRILLEGTFTRILDYLTHNNDREIPLATIHSA